MISDIFIDRPRLAFVISIVITLAGLLAIAAIPVAQFPDIVPPQVSLTTLYPGADPDINTVNVQNRAQLATPLLPQEVQRQGLTIRKKSAALLQIITLYAPKNTHDALYLNNYATINVLDPLSRVR